MEMGLNINQRMPATVEQVFLGFWRGHIGGLYGFGVAGIDGSSRFCGQCKDGLAIDIIVINSPNLAISWFLAGAFIVPHDSSLSGDSAFDLFDFMLATI